MTLDVGVAYEDLDIQRVRSSLRNAFPVGLTPAPALKNLQHSPGQHEDRGPNRD